MMVVVFAITKISYLSVGFFQDLVQPLVMIFDYNPLIPAHNKRSHTSISKLVASDHVVDLITHYQAKKFRHR